MASTLRVFPTQAALRSSAGVGRGFQSSEVLAFRRNYNRFRSVRCRAEDSPRQNKEREEKEDVAVRTEESSLTGLVGEDVSFNDKVGGWWSVDIKTKGSCWKTDLAWDPYLGEVAEREKDEEPAQYVPPPNLRTEDSDMQENVECLLYTLKNILPGQLDADKADAICSMLSPSVEVHSPAVSFCGSTRFSKWLQALIQVEASINLHEIYCENLVENHDKRWVYVVWTTTFPQHVHPKVDECSTAECSFALEYIQLSGETVFELEKSGLVSGIRSTWYVLREDGEALFAKAMDRLQHLLSDHFRST